HSRKTKSSRRNTRGSETRMHCLPHAGCIQETVHKRDNGTAGSVRARPDCSATILVHHLQPQLHACFYICNKNSLICPYQDSLISPYIERLGTCASGEPSCLSAVTSNSQPTTAWCCEAGYSYRGTVTGHGRRSPWPTATPE